MPKKTFTLILDEELYQQIRKLAFEDNISVGEWIRRVIREKLKKEER
jgi:predicted HicB family RNase H-like nuclease